MLTVVVSVAAAARSDGFCDDFATLDAQRRVLPVREPPGSRPCSEASASATDRFTLVDWTEQSSLERLLYSAPRVHRDKGERLSSVPNGSLRQPPKRASGESPAMRAMRSSSAGQA